MNVPNGTRRRIGLTDFRGLLHSSTDDFIIVDLKRRKLHIKEKI
jgi:hypothetical protein